MVSEKQGGTFKGQISITWHIRFHNFIYYHAELVKCDFFPSAIWYKMYILKMSKILAFFCHFIFLHAHHLKPSFHIQEQQLLRFSKNTTYKSFRSLKDCNLIA